MFHYIEDFILSIYYLKKQDSFLKVLINIFCFLFFSICFRAQIPEIKFLQYLPGFSLVCFILAFFILFLSHDKLFSIGLHEDTIYSGLKTLEKVRNFISFKYSIYCFFLSLNVLFHLIFPLTIDSLVNYENTSLENLWSLYQILTIEIFLIFCFFLFSQLPLFINFVIYSQNTINKLPFIWKSVFFFSIVFSGIITPTIDGTTQLNLAIFIITFYFLIVNFIEKKLLIRFFNLICLNF